MQNLDARQKRTLSLYLILRHTDPTVLRLIGYNWRLYLLLFLLGLVIGLVDYAVGLSFILPIFAAAILGAVFRDIGHFRKTVRNWPLVREITDWEKAETLAHQASNPENQGP